MSDLAATRNAEIISWREVGFSVLMVRSIMETLGLDWVSTYFFSIKVMSVDIRWDADGNTSHFAF
jgi:hypothetical protein